MRYMQATEQMNPAQEQEESNFSYADKMKNLGVLITTLRGDCSP